MSDQPMDTRRLVKLAQRGDSDAIAALYQMYVDTIYRYVAYRVGSQADAEDLTAEVFVRMVKSLPDYQDTGAPFDAWLHRIAAVRVADFYRQQGRRPQVDLTENLASNTPLPEEVLQDEQEHARLREALQQLSGDDQTVLILRFVERKSHQEVAQIVGKSVSAVKSIQHRALVKLASLLGSEEKIRHYLRGNDD
jgi:RNA polymerase sigma-70 factor, ECF subfamily